MDKCKNPCYINGRCAETCKGDGEVKSVLLSIHPKWCELIASGEKTVEVFKTICYTTMERQCEAREISKKCDAMVVIGGESSSNTKKLYDNGESTESDYTGRAGKVRQPAPASEARQGYLQGDDGEERTGEAHSRTVLQDYGLRDDRERGHHHECTLGGASVRHPGAC